MRKHYVSFDLPGAFFPEHASREIQPGEKFPIPDNAYAWNTYEIIVSEVEGVEVRSAQQNVGPRHLIVDKGPFTAAELRELHPDKRILASNAESYERGVAQCPPGNWQPIQDDDVLVPAADVARRRLVRSSSGE